MPDRTQWVTTGHVATVKQQSIRLTPEDLAIVAEIQRRTGLIGVTDAVRFALRQYAMAQGSEPLKPRKKKR